MFFTSESQEPPAMTLEGVLGPNRRIDEAQGFIVDSPHALCVAADGQLLFSSGKMVRALSRWDADPTIWASFDASVIALGGSPSGHIAVGLEGARIAVLGAGGEALSDWSAPHSLQTVTDCAFSADDELVVVDNGYPADQDFMSIAPWDEVARGQIIALSRSGSRTLCEGLHCPMGITQDWRGEWMASLFERAAIVNLAGNVLQSGYPAYPGRIHRTATGYIMTCLARRDPLIEFLKTEREFIAEMKATMQPRYWISPRRSPEFSHDFPIESGATRLFGEIKPWAPSFSYGLVIELDEKLIPVASAHSRANGFRHEITDAVVWNGDLIAVSRASGEIVRVASGGAV